ncbi:endolytic transglycosylase MltG [Pseudidiomarina insulisalsae]|uniref:endolytic transglycosylase MltG n=1 Tax=Pseudidiomarina insulisalsae TaxID=575789 RepID=UPI00130019D7|nr:endolytic transglycosylase MltG [Pseudidiomarina insulisalsae]
MAIVRRVIVIVLLVLLLGAAGATYYSYNLLQRPLQVPAGETLVEVSRGAHAKAVLRELQQQQLWSANPELTYLASRLWAAADQLQAGVYQVQPGQTLGQFWQQLQQGRQHQFAITLVEGQTLAQWLRLLQQHPYLSDRELQQTDALTVAVAGSDRWPSLEGLLAPDTYHFYAGTGVIELLRTAYQTQQQRLQAAWQQRAPQLPYTEPYELLIMASIIEKETGVSGERDIVSSVFVNRLREGMRLQSDPTTIYGIADFDGNLTRAHLRERTPYNTYRIDGLPPTPIAMPGQASLRAAAQPAQTDYFYFVADGSGGHVFSKTLAEHNRAVDRYQRGKH